ncbi:hypothetical protein [Duganella sp. P38]|uniref:hypothetical protein n=1 Tax=Duganella sp. P38 TaxID=3423949 RepID=UPI003D78D3F4
MQKFLIGALALASLGAQAQSSLTVYGVADAGLVMERGGEAGAVQKLEAASLPARASASRAGRTWAAAPC